MGRRAKRKERRRNRRADRRQGPAGGKDDWSRYIMTQKLAAIGDDYYVQNQVGEQVLVIDGKALRARDTLRMRDLLTGDEYKIQEKIARVTDTMTIQQNGERVAAVKKALITPVRERFLVRIPGMSPLNVVGNILNHEYRMMRDGVRVAEVSKKWFRVRDTYGVEVAPVMDPGLVIASTVALDMMIHSDG